MKKTFKSIRNKLTSIILCFLIIAFYFYPFFIPMSTSYVIAEEKGSDDLTTAIKDKNSELDYIKNQISETQKKLEETKSTKNTLSSEINRANYSINQINLEIESSKVNIEKLDLESKAIKIDIQDAEKDVDIKQDALREVIRKVQEKDNESVLYIMIKNKALSDSLFEIQALKDVYNDLLVKINDLNTTKNKLSTNLNKNEAIKDSKENEIINLANKKIIQNQTKEEKTKILDITKNKEKTYQEYIETLKERQAKVLQEIFDIESKLTNGINFENLPKKLPGLLEEPVTGKYIITQEYGITPYSKKFYSSGFHNGIDVAAPIGRPIIAPSDGIVVAVGNQDSYCWHGAYGKFVVIHHYMGLTTLFGHMSLYTVKEGQTVKKGQIIGYIGQTGMATGPHLHFSIYDSSTFKMGQSRVCGPMPYGGHISPRNYVIF